MDKFVNVFMDDNQICIYIRAAIFYGEFMMTVNFIKFQLHRSFPRIPVPLHARLLVLPADLPLFDNPYFHISIIVTYAESKVFTDINAAGTAMEDSFCSELEMWSLLKGKSIFINTKSRIERNTATIEYDGDVEIWVIEEREVSGDLSLSRTSVSSALTFQAYVLSFIRTTLAPWLFFASISS